MTLSRNDTKKLTASVELNNELEAPITKGQQVGEIIYSVNDKQVGKQPLVALEPVEEGSFFSRLIDQVKKFVMSFFK